MFYPRRMLRLTWFLPREYLAGGLETLARTGEFHLIDHVWLGEQKDLQALEKNVAAQVAAKRQRKAVRMLERLPKNSLLNYRMGEMPPGQLKGMNIEGLVKESDGRFLWAASDAPPEALTPYLYPPEPAEASELPLELEAYQWRLLFDAAASIGHVDGWAVIDGWVPAAAQCRMEKLLNNEAACLCPAEDAQLAMDEVPVAYQRPAWLDGFGAMMRNFGLTGYRELDPTLIMAVGFVALFGMMFADLGQGLLLSASGVGLLYASGRGLGPQWLRGRPAMLAAQVLIPIGLSAALFGALFGSCFSREDLIPALWFHPLDEVGFYLGMSLAIGMGVIFFGLLLGLVNAYRMGRLSEVAGEKFGPPGLVFYSGLGLVAYALLQEETVLLMAGGVLCIAAAIAVACYKYAKQSHEATWVRLFLGLLEAYDLSTRFVVQTLSFVRIAAFTLAHIGLSKAVILMSGALAGEPFLAMATLVFGNLFIIILEGVLVSIQVLRLHFFEFFSKFVVAGGRAFSPLTLKGEAQC